jgi:hypothetical protein
MSILWALSGSMDTRLVSDGRAADVAYDINVENMISLPKAKTTKKKGNSSEPVVAEVTLEGLINGKSFELVRRRSSKKSELLFSVDGSDLTTQSVVDTQSIVV